MAANHRQTAGHSQLTINGPGYDRVQSIRLYPLAATTDVALEFPGTSPNMSQPQEEVGDEEEGDDEEEGGDQVPNRPHV